MRGRGAQWTRALSRRPFFITGRESSTGTSTPRAVPHIVACRSTFRSARTVRGEYASDSASRSSNSQAGDTFFNAAASATAIRRFETPSYIWYVRRSIRWPSRTAPSGPRRSCSYSQPRSRSPTVLTWRTSISTSALGLRLLCCEQIDREEDRNLRPGSPNWNYVNLTSSATEAFESSIPT